MDDYDIRVNDARQRIHRVLTALRLATGSTAHAVVDIAGEPHQVRWISPSITPLPHVPGWRFFSVDRSVTLTEEDVPSLSNLVSLTASWDSNDDWMAVRVALGRLGRSLDGWTPNLVDQVVDLAIGLEAALGGTDSSEIALRLRMRAANILATDADSADTIYRDIKILYDLRSMVVHGGIRWTKNAVDKALKNVSTVTPSSWPAEQPLLALDRWRDLLRRSILARIALTTADEAWPIKTKGNPVLDIDQLLLLETTRNEWRQHIQTFWIDRGIPDAPNRAGSPRRASTARTKRPT